MAMPPLISVSRALHAEVSVHVAPAIDPGVQSEPGIRLDRTAATHIGPRGWPNERASGRGLNPSRLARPVAFLAVAKPLEEWTVEELRTELRRLGDELARRAGAPASAPAKKGAVAVAYVCEHWVRGHAWDETFTVEMVDDEFAVRERRNGQTLTPSERERLLELWRTLRDERAA
jgi:hypothetical protein